MKNSSSATASPHNIRMHTQPNIIVLGMTIKYIQYIVANQAAGDMNTKPHFLYQHGICFVHYDKSDLYRVTTNITHTIYIIYIPNLITKNTTFNLQTKKEI